MDGFILSVNVGSTSLRHALHRVTAGRLEAGCVLRGHGQQLEGVRAFMQALDALRGDIRQRAQGWPLLAVAHRVVHGGAEVQAAVHVTPLVMRHLEAIESLAPLHQPFNLMGIRLFEEFWPSVPQIACPDTAMHADLPAVERAFALPKALRDQGYHRYGFHGLSCASVLDALEAAGANAGGRVLIAHLGGGCSVSAFSGRQPMATSMGFSTLDGLVMSTRSGSLDPGVLISLMDRGWTRQQLQDLLYLDSGLKGLSGLSGDLRVLRAQATPAARFAIDVYVHRIVREIGAQTACVGGCDLIAFTGGAGEGDARLRAEVVDRLSWLGCALASSQNEEARVDVDAKTVQAIHAADSRVGLWTVACDETRVAAGQALACISP